MVCALAQNDICLYLVQIYLLLMLIFLVVRTLQTACGVVPFGKSFLASFTLYLIVGTVVVTSPSVLFLSPSKSNLILSTFYFPVLFFLMM